MRLLICCFCALFCLTTTTASATNTSPRVALVMGNGAYTDTTPLPNASNDGRALAETLRGMNFQVFEGIDLNRGQMQSLIAEFSRALRDAEVGLFFYAGHGMQVEGKNHLVPVNAVIEDDADLPFQTIPLDIILTQMERNVPTRLVFLDACRDNPIARNLARSLGGTSRSVNVDQGLAQMQAGVGTLIAYATEPDAVALDGEGDHSPFTSALLTHLQTPGLEIRQMLTRVRQDVLASTNNQQIPWDHSSLTGEFYFQPPQQVATPETTAAPSAPVATAVAPTPQDHSIELAFWQSIQQIQEPQAKRQALDAYLKQYPEGQFVPLAQVLISALPVADQANRSVEQIPPAEPLVQSEETPPISEVIEAPPPETPVEETTSVAMVAPGSPEIAEPEPELDPIAAAEAAEAALGLSRAQQRRVQMQLTALGFDTRGIDGIFGENTRRAIREFQDSRELAVTGFLRRKDLTQLREEGRPAVARMEEAARQAAAQREAEAARQATARREAEAARQAAARRDAEATRQATARREAEAARQAAARRDAEATRQAEAEAEKTPNYAFRRCMMNYEKSYSDCVREHGEP